MSGDTVSPDDFRAKSVAAMANWIKRPIFLISFFSMYCPGLKFFTSPAIWQLNAEASKEPILEIPLAPLRIDCQVSSVPIPTELRSPTPVTTTLRDNISLRWKADPGGAYLTFLLSM